MTQGDESSRLLCENPVVRDKNFRLVTSLALVSTALLDTSPCVKNEGRLSKHRKSLTTPLTRALRPLFLTSSDRGRQYDHDRRDTRERNAHGSGVVKLFLFFDRRPSFLTQEDVSSRLLCENLVVRDKNFRLVTSLALVSTAQATPCLRQSKSRTARRQPHPPKPSGLTPTSAFAASTAQPTRSPGQTPRHSLRLVHGC